MGKLMTGSSNALATIHPDMLYFIWQEMEYDLAGSHVTQSLNIKQIQKLYKIFKFCISVLKFYIKTLIPSALYINHRH